MNILIDVNIISPHTVPLAKALALICGEENVCYQYQSEGGESFRTAEVARQLGNMGLCAEVDKKPSEAVLVNADVILTGRRDLGMMESLLKKGKSVFYMSERWFKPIRVDAPRHSEYARGSGVSVPGFARILIPGIWRRCLKIWRLMRRDDCRFCYLANGILAASDMARICGLLNGDWRCLFRPPRLSFESCPGGRVWAEDGEDKRYCLDKIRIWGYFVSRAASEGRMERLADSSETKVLWAGRLLGCKRVDTLIKAVKGLPNVMLDIFGAGPEEPRLKTVARGACNVHFYPPVQMSLVRRQMRLHDVYVLSSNEVEGWGAVVNEALEEGMRVIGTYEAGACVTILPKSNLFHSGDWQKLRAMLQKPIPKVDIGPWTAEGAACALIRLVKEMEGNVICAKASD